MMVTREFAKTCFDAIQDDAPADVPRWDGLHEVERDQLTSFVNEVLDELIRREWHVWHINYYLPPLRAMMQTRVLAATAQDAKEVLESQKPRARVRAVLRPQPKPEGIE